MTIGSIREAETMEHSAARPLLWVVLILLPLVLLGLGIYLVNIPQGIVLAGVPQTVWFGVGQSVIASALVSLVMLVAAWADRRTASEQLPIVLRTLSEYRNASDMIKQTGLRRVHSDRYIRSVYQEHQANVVEHLDLLGMSLKHFQQDVGDQLIHWVQAHDGLRLRLLVPDPCSGYCAVRDLEEGRPAGDTSQWVLRLTHLVLETNHPRIQIRWHATIPTVSIYRLDEVIFIGPYLINRLSRLTTTLEVDVKSLLAEQYLMHFESLWVPPKEHPEWSHAPTSSEVEAARARLKK